MRDDGRFVQRDLNRIAAAFELVPRAGDVHQDAPHQLRGHGEEVRAVLPPHAARIDQAQIGLVDERRGLQRVAGTLSRHVAMREPVEFVVHQRHQPIQRLLVSLIPGQQQFSDLQVTGHSSSERPNDSSERQTTP